MKALERSEAKDLLFREIPGAMFICTPDWIRHMAADFERDLFLIAGRLNHPDVEVRLGVDALSQWCEQIKEGDTRD